VQRKSRLMRRFSAVFTVDKRAVYVAAELGLMGAIRVINPSRMDASSGMINIKAYCELVSSDRPTLNSQPRGARGMFGPFRTRPSHGIRRHTSDTV
jgi:hypothetical protein